MVNSVFRVKFEKSSYDLEYDYEVLSGIDREKISELNAIGTFDYNDFDDKYLCLIITTHLELSKYLDVLRNNFVKFEYDDITKDILTNKINLESELSYHLNSIYSLKYSFFIDDLNEWIYDNLDIDIILDRISDVGINNLKEIEVKFLKNYK
jgi:hypothetical protein